MDAGRGIVADQQDGRRVENITHGRSCILFSRERGGEGREVGGAMMVDVVGAKDRTREFL